MVDEDLRFKREILGVAILLILGSLHILFPFLDAIILAFATSYFLRVAHRGLDRRLDNELLSTFIIISSLVGVFTLSIFFLLNNSYQIINTLTGVAANMEANVQALLDSLNITGNFRLQVLGLIDSFRISLENSVRSILTGLPSLFIDLGIYLVTAIYLYKDGERLKRQTMSVIDTLPENEEKIVRSLVQSVDSIFRGVFMTQMTVAFILTIVTAVGFYAIGFFTSFIPFTIFWAVLIGIAALMPLFAAFMVYGPIGLYYLVFGAPVKGALILTFGVIVLNILPEVFLRPFVGSKQMDEHPLIIFTGFIAGPLTLGLKGFILGPIILILSKEFMLNYSELVSQK